MSQPFLQKFQDDVVTSCRRDYDGMQDLLFEWKDKGPATSVRFNTETRRLELVYEETR